MTTGRPDQVPDKAIARWALLALAVGAFGIGTTEFAPMGMLPVIARGVDVSVPTAGLLVSAYALGVMIGAPIMTMALSHLRRPTALMLLMGIFTLGNLMSAVAPNYALLMVSRVVTSLCHGAFFGLGSIVAMRLVPQEKRAAAVSTMFMGLTIANVGGVPLATWVGGYAGWRVAFAGTAALGLITIVALVLALPKGERSGRPDLKSELGVIGRVEVLLAMGTTVMGAGAMFTLYTYIVAAMERITDASDAFVTLTLILVGLGFTVGNWLGGKLAGWSLDGATALFLSGQAIMLLLLPVLLESHVGIAIGAFLWGVTAFAMVAPIQTRVMHAAQDAPALASSLNIGAFNLGNALGAAIGGGVLAAGLGYQIVPVAAAALAILAVLLVWAGRSGRGGEAVAS